MTSLVGSPWWAARAQSGQWNWTGGGSALQAAQGTYKSLPGVYGTLGSASMGNNPGGRTAASTWRDTNGNFWLFGGFGADANGTQGYLNDLWEFNASNGEWAWMSGSSSVPGDQLGVRGVYGALGVPAAPNVPGGRKAALTWVDASGIFWLFGGYGFDSTGTAASELNDLWEFNRSTNQWTWVSGSSTGSEPGAYGTQGIPASGNLPGGRDSAIGWMDSGDHLWLFGGHGVDYSNQTGSLNDLWEFDSSTGQWTWVGGSNMSNQPGAYGTLGAASAENIPGARHNARAWRDAGGAFWLFGGTGLDSAGSGEGELNDLWTFTASTLEWTWMGGSSSSGQAGTYGTLGVPSSNNMPGARDSSVAWIDPNSNLWVSGGHGYDSTGYLGQLNDLWMFNFATRQWSWKGGSSAIQIGTYNCAQISGRTECGHAGVYGAMGSPAAANLPGSRNAACGWVDDAGNLWLFGGAGFDSVGHFGNMNDLWQYLPASGTQPAVATPAFSPGSGTYQALQTVTINDSTPGATIFYTTDGATPTTNSTVYSGPIAVSTSETLQAMATAVGYSASDVASAAYTIQLPAATPTFSPDSGTFSSPQRVIISDSTPGAVIYYTVDGTTPNTNSNIYYGPLTLSVPQTLKAIAGGGSLLNSPVASASYTISQGPPVWVLSTNSTSFNPSPFPAVNRACCGRAWNYLETARGNFSWSSFDAWRAQTAAHPGSKNMYTFYGVPTWANTSGNAYDSPNDIDTVAYCQNVLSGTRTTDCQFKEFVTAMMQHSCGVSHQPSSPLTGACNLSYVEMWNELNADIAWTGSYTQLATMANDAATIVRLYCGDCLIVGGSVAAGGDGYHFNGQSGVYSTALLNFLTAWGGISGASLPDMVSIHPYPSRTDVAPVPFPTTNVSNGSAYCTSANVPNVHCRVPIYTQISTVKSPTVLQNPAIASWASKLTVIGTEGMWGLTANICNGSTCAPSDPGVIFLRTAYVSEWMIALAAQGTPLQLEYVDNDQCWGTLYGTGTTQSNCASNPIVPAGAAPWFPGWSQTATWLNSATITGPLVSTPVSGGKVWKLPLSIDGKSAEIDFFDGWWPATYAASTSFPTQQDLSGSSSETNGSVLLSQKPVLLTNVSLPSAAAPIFTPSAGTYSSTQSVIISASTPSSTIYYTTDGSTPTATSPQYTSPISVNATTPVKAIATASGYASSGVSTALYTISLPATSAPTFSPAAGTYTTAQTVTISDSTPGTTIYYTTNGTAPTASSTVYAGPIPVSSTETIQAIAAASGYSNSAVVSAAYTIAQPAAPPTFSPAGGTYTTAQTVTISDSTPDAIIYYTTNGSTPTTGSTIYAGPLGVSSTQTLNAIAAAQGYSQSSVASATYTITPTAVPPTFSPAGGMYASPQTVTISDSTPGATIYYTTNGSTPTTGSTIYAGPVTVSSTETLKAIANATGYSASPVTSVTYTITASAATPAFSPAGGSFTAAQTVTISDVTPGVTIYFTSNGTTPTTSSSVYAGPITVSVTETLKAMAIAQGYTQSAIASATYTIAPTVAATPTFSPAGGKYTSVQSVTISDATPAASIYYTTNGTTPTTGSTKYTGAIIVSSSKTINAIAVASGYAQSAVGSATYSIQLPLTATPNFSPAPGTYKKSRTVTISDSTSGATIYYTTNGTTPTTSSKTYTGAITVSTTETIMAIAVASGHSQSAMASGTYTIK